MFAGEPFVLLHGSQLVGHVVPVLVTELLAFAEVDQSNFLDAVLTLLLLIPLAE